MIRDILLVDVVDAWSITQFLRLKLNRCVPLIPQEL